MRRILERSFVLVAMWLFAGAVHGAISVVDDTGATVTLGTPAKRIVTLAPHAAELVFAAGAGASIVGVIKGSDFPAEVRNLPVIGDAVALDLERVVMLAPDLIVTWPWTTPEQTERLRARGIAVFEADAREVTGIADDVERIGVLAGSASVARANAAALRERVAKIVRGTDAGSMPPLRVFYQVSDLPMFTLGGHHLVSNAIAQCGGRNVFDALTIPAPQVSVEAVLAADPQVIIAGTDGAKPPRWLDAWRSWSSVEAVRRGALYTVDANLLHRPGPRFIDGIAALCTALADARRKQRR
jgi:iron complex transport system substrate-binding protein